MDRIPGITLCTAAGLSIVLQEPVPSPKTPETDLSQLLAQLDELQVTLDKVGN